MDIYYVTSNKAKFEEASLILQIKHLQECGIHIHHALLHLEEIQGAKEEIVTHKIQKAVQHFNVACIVDDVSLYCRSLGGLPGPYIRSFLEAIGDVQFAELVAHYPDRSCTAVCSIAYMAPDEQSPHLFEGTIEGSIVAARGSRKHHTNWNAIFQPLGSTQTYAEMSLEQMSRCSARYRALSSFRNFLLTNHS